MTRLTAGLAITLILTASVGPGNASPVRIDPRVEFATLPQGPDEAPAPLIRQAGSIAKYVCTLAAVRMENAGLLSLDAPVMDLLPSYSGPRDPALTLRRLLENRSGLEDGLAAALSQDMGLLAIAMPSAEAANRFSSVSSTTPPGEVFGYVNSNWVLVQAILEQAGGQSIGPLLDEWVFTPSGAEGAFIFTGILDGARVARVDREPIPIPNYVACAGGMAAQPSDLLAISAFPFTSGLFDEADRADLTGQTTPEEAYALGGRFERVRDADGRVRQVSWQTGSNGPWFATVIYDPETGQGFAAMTASDRDEAMALQEDWLARRGLEYLERPAPEVD